MCTTYHNVADGWYLIVPEEWKDQITLRRRDSIGQRSVIFITWRGRARNPRPSWSSISSPASSTGRTPPTALSCGRREGGVCRRSL